MKKLLMDIKEYMEDREVILDDEWGLSHTSTELESLGLMPDLYYNVLRKIEESK